MFHPEIIVITLLESISSVLNVRWICHGSDIEIQLIWYSNSFEIHLKSIWNPFGIAIFRCLFTIRFILPYTIHSISATVKMLKRKIDRLLILQIEKHLHNYAILPASNRKDNSLMKILRSGINYVLINIFRRKSCRFTRASAHCSHISVNAVDVLNSLVGKVEWKSKTLFR